MSKQEINTVENIMDKIKTGKIKMKSRWYFMIGSIITFIGIVFLAITVIFLINLIFFSLRTHGLMGDFRYEQLISNFPWWAPIVAIMGICLGVWILKKFDFSYKNNFVLIIIGTILLIIATGWFIDFLGFNRLLEKGPMKGFYRQHNGGEYKIQNWRR